MTAVFTSSAVANLQMLAASTKDKDELSSLMKKLNTLPVGSAGLRDAGGNLLVHYGDMDVFVIPSGQLQAVVSTSPQTTSSVVVSGVYRSTDSADEILRKAMEGAKETTTEKPG